MRDMGGGLRGRSAFTAELCSPTLLSLAEILVLAGTTGADRMTMPASTRISARLERVHEHSSPVYSDGQDRPMARCVREDPR